jgi:Fe-S cluster assembly scaffold protein SufB
MINRKATSGIYSLSEIFPGLKQEEVILQIFETKANVDDVFEKTRVIIDENSKYMHVDNNDASIVIGKSHLQESEKIILYLDIVHELVHVKQQHDGLDLYNKAYSYVDRPTEIEAYEVAVQEAKKLGMQDKEIFDYLSVDWITDEEHQRLASRVGVFSKKT